MVELDDTLSVDDANRYLYEWQQIATELAKLKSKEFLLRDRLFRHFFPEPREGTNTAPLGNGYTLKATHVLNRDIDMEALERLDNELKAQGIATADLVRFKPSLVTPQYRQLTAEQRNLFDTVLTIKPGAPTLKIDAPKKKGQPDDNDA